MNTPLSADLIRAEGAVPPPSEPLFRDGFGGLDLSDPVIQQRIAEVWEAAAVFGTVLVLIAALWWGLNRLPRPRRIPSLLWQIRLARVVAISVVLATVFVSWDLWWHQAVGRDTFWEPPHLGLYTFACIAMLGSMLGWHATHGKHWRTVLLVLLLIPIAAPFDQFWHTIFGVEDLTRPHLLIWSPPHLAVALAAVFAQIALLPLLARDTNASLRGLMGMIVFGNLIATGMYLVLPVHPTEGFGQLIGFWGAGAMAIPLIAGSLIGRSWLRDSAGSTKISFATTVITLIAYVNELAPGIVMLPHDRMPNWIICATFLLASAWIDASERVWLPLRGLIGGMISAAMMFATARYFLDAAFFYENANVAIALLSGSIGGCIGAVGASRVTRTPALTT